MTKNDDLSAQAKNLGREALKLAGTARAEAGRFVQEHTGQIDSAIDKATGAVEAKTGKDHQGVAAKVKDAAAKGAALLAGDSAAERAKGDAGPTGPAASWPDAGDADMPVIPTDPPSTASQQRPQDHRGDHGSAV